MRNTKFLWVVERLIGEKWEYWHCSSLRKNARGVLKGLKKVHTNQNKFRITRYWSERVIEIVHLGVNNSFYEFDETDED